MILLLSSTEYTTEVRVASPVQEEVAHHLRRHHLHLEGNLYDQQRDTCHSITDVAKYIYDIISSAITTSSQD